MKKALIVIFVLGYAMIACGQQAYQTIRHPLHYASAVITLDSTEATKIYVGFTSTTDLAIKVDTTAFTTALPQYQRGIVMGTGDVFIGVTPDTVAAEESDSLSASIRPYWFNKNKGTWFESSTEVAYINFVTPTSYCQNTAVWLDWTHGYHYNIQLSNEMWSCGGFTLTLSQKAYNTTDASSRFYVDIWIVY